MKNEHQLMDRENLKTSKVHFLNATSVINVYKGMFLSFQKTKNPTRVHNIHNIYS